MSGAVVTTEAELSPLLAAIAAPIPGDNVAGIDVTYDDDFQRIKSEIDALASASAGGADFALVCELGEKVLRSKSKDLRIACYLAMALERTKGLEGVADGLVATDMLCESYWEELYPPLRRMAARQNALQSLSDRLKEWLADVKPRESDREDIERALEAVRRLQSLTMDRMEDRAPALSGLAQTLETLQRRVPKPAEPESASQPSETTEKAVATPRPTGQTVAVSTDDLSRSDAERAVLRIADGLLKNDRSDPFSYRLVRAALWSDIHDEPPSENGNTMIPPPPEQRLSYLQGLADRGEFESLADESEAALQEYPLWLDLQRFTYLALEGLGSTHWRARNAVAHDTALLVRELPGLPLLRFNDRTPLASPLTRAWIETTLEASSGGSHGLGRQSDQEGLEQHFEDARKLLSSGDLNGALAKMRGSDGENFSGSTRFRRRLFEARLCLDAGAPVVARPILEGLYEDIQRHGLSVWDPELSLNTLSVLHDCYAAIIEADEGDSTSVIARKSEDIFALICRIDPSAGVNMNPRKW